MATDPAAILKMPAFPLPPGVERNLENPPSKNKLALGVMIVEIILATGLVCLRVYSRASLIKVFKLEDYIGVFSLGLFYACIAMTFYFYNSTGIWVHQWNVTLGQLFTATYYLSILKVIYSAAMLSTKTAILLDWIRIFVPRGTRPAFLWVLRAVIAIHFAFYISVIFLLIFACKPAAASFDSSIPDSERHCLNRRALDIGTSSFNLAFDLGMLLLPQGSIWSLQMSVQRKLQISSVFAVGVLGCAGAAGRLWSTVTIDYSGEVTYKISAMVMFALMEVTCAIIVFCTPSIPKIFQTSSLLTNLAATLRSWASISRASISRSSRADSSPHGSNGSWSRTNRATEVGGPYSKLGDRKDGSTPMVGLEAVPNMGTTASGNASSSSHSHTQSQGRNEIWHTTEFSTREEEVPVTDRPHAK